MLVVKKFGGSSVADKERIFNVARRCAEEYQMGNDVIVVLSAMGDTTDELLEKAVEINPYPSKRELDMLLTTGEQVSVALMAMALQFLHVPAISLNAFHCITLVSITQCCRESTAFNRDPLQHAAWIPLHSTWIHCPTLHAILFIHSGCITQRCMESSAFNHATGNPLHSIRIHWAMLHGIH